MELISAIEIIHITRIVTITLYTDKKETLHNRSYYFVLYKGGQGYLHILKSDYNVCYFRDLLL